ncbi:FkbM family methyltransferase [Rhodopirellula baltica]|uniref:Methyltransferase FkbM family n=1 Tax=Rhodopirellula baltica SWK14 TaxID=993516 RepID=L7CF62_RHOBT|nr:FkbM family methyltransferase [Rhodopirellula baltica]ELP32460.1 methyltransferase FkbM family [Rhodopirellula baltica SWK14]
MFNYLLKYARRKTDPISLLQQLTKGSSEYRTLVHVGAHLGQERTNYESKGYQKILWIEGSEEIHAKLADSLRQHDGPAEHSTACALLSDRDGEEIGLRCFSNDGMSNSIFAPAEQLTSRWPTVKETGEIEMQRSVSLDRLLANTPFANDCDVLVVDVQGAELLVLKGGLTTLSRVKAVVCEVSTVPYYEGGVLFKELNQFMESHGFHAMSTPRRHGDMLFMPKAAQSKLAA